MTQIQFLTDWAHCAAGAAFWVCLAWPAIVRTFWPWHRDQWGWNMVIKTEMIALALLPSVLDTEFGITPGLPLEWVLVIAVTVIPVTVAWRTWIIWRAQADGARNAERGGGSGREDAR